MGIIEFHVVDYALFGVSLVVSVGVGIFYAIKDRNIRNTDEVFLGGRKMAAVPVALSMLASFQSAVSIIGIPGDIYTSNTMYLYYNVLGNLFAAIGCVYLYIPILYNLQITSAFEYLSMRFHSSVQAATSVLFGIQMLLYMAVVLYAPSLALNTVTGFPLWPIVIVIGIVCIFYTTIGGMKAVVWVDSFQMLVIFAGLLALLIQGCIETGGLAEAWNAADAKGLIKFDEISTDPTVAHSVWSLVIGGTFTTMAVYATNQAQVQRACACPTLTKARIAYWLNVPGIALTGLLYVLIGVIMFAYYIDRDPINSGHAENKDQLVPIFVMDILSKYPGVPGLFLACIFSGSLSTISSGLNAIAAAVMQDIIRPTIAPKISDNAATWVSRAIAVFMGGVCLGLTYVASLLGSIIRTVLGLFGAVGGPILGVFTFGMCFPWANKFGALAGLLTSLALNLWILIGASVTARTVEPGNSTLSMSINSTSLNETILEPSPLMQLYKLSYQYYALLAVLVNIIVGMLVSVLTGLTKPSTVDVNLVTPLYAKLDHYLPEGQRLRRKHDSDALHLAEMTVSSPTYRKTSD